MFFFFFSVFYAVVICASDLWLLARGLSLLIMTAIMIPRPITTYEVQYFVISYLVLRSTSHITAESRYCCIISIFFRARSALLLLSIYHRQRQRTLHFFLVTTFFLSHPYKYIFGISRSHIPPEHTDVTLPSKSWTRLGP